MSGEEILIKDRMDRGSPQMNGWKQGNSGKDSRNNRRGKRMEEQCEGVSLSGGVQFGGAIKEPVDE